MITDENSLSTLLARFTELAPAEWEAYLTDEGWTGAELKYTVGEFRLTAGIALHLDRASAEALVFLWDYLEGRGYAWCAESRDPQQREKDVFVFSLGRYRDGKRGEATRVWEDVGIAECGRTLIEAIVKACLSLWTAEHESPEKGKGSLENTPSPTPSEASQKEPPTKETER